MKHTYTFENQEITVYGRLSDDAPITADIYFEIDYATWGNGIELDGDELDRLWDETYDIARSIMGDDYSPACNRNRLRIDRSFREV